MIDKKFGSILLLVPHEDDEILMGAGILYQAVRAKLDTNVVIVTNGDYEGVDLNAGRARMQESLNGLALLGIQKEQVHFLGYADTGMDKESSFLHRLYKEKDGEKIVASRVSETTYGLEDMPDYHRKNFHEQGKYNRNTLKADIKGMIEKIGAENIFTTAEYDVHGDHSALYFFVREVLVELKKETRYSPRLYVGLVHSPAGDDKWPHRIEKTDISMEAFTCPLDWAKSIPWNWEERIRFLVPKCMRSTNSEENLKYRALSMHKSALKADAVAYLYSFVKTEEIFFERKE